MLPVLRTAVSGRSAEGAGDGGGWGVGACDVICVGDLDAEELDFVKEVVHKRQVPIADGGAGVPGDV